MTWRICALVLKGTLLCLLALSMASTALAQLTAERYTGRFIPVQASQESGFDSVTVTGLSDDGWVMTGHAGADHGEVPFVWRAMHFRPMNGLPEGLTGSGLAAGWREYEFGGESEFRMAVVGYLDNASGGEPFLWVDGEGLLPLDGLDGTNGQATGTSISGPGLVGWHETARGQEAFYWTPSGVVDLGDLNGGVVESRAWGVSRNSRLVVGEAQSDQGLEAFLFTVGGSMRGLGDLPGGAHSSSARAVGQDPATGEVTVVGMATSAQGQEAFRWTESGGMHGLGDLPGGEFRSQALDVDASGRFVVGAARAAEGDRAFIWDSRDGMLDLLALMRDEFGLEELAGWTFEAATGIATGMEMDGSTDAMLVAGYGRDPHGVRGSFRVIFYPRDGVEPHESDATCVRYLLLH